jgi:hypothetical protein
VAGVNHGVGCQLCVRNGVLDFLEGYTYEEEWPEHLLVLAIRRVRPVTESFATSPDKDGPST